MDIKVVICRTCGYFKGNLHEWKNCPACGSVLEELDLPIDDFLNMTKSEKSDYRLNHLGVNPSEEMANKRIRYEEELDRKLSATNGRPRIQCPYCKSYNTKKITAASRMFSTNLFGIASDKIGKQWHCNNCKSDF